MKSFTGKDRLIKKFLETFPEFSSFTKSFQKTLQHLLKSNYDFSATITRISIYIGCTGGRHRSVALAENLAKYLLENTKNPVEIIHPHL